MKKVVSFLMVALMVAVLFAGCSGKNGNDTIKVGVGGCHTGPYAMYGLAVRNGVELYVNKLNENGGINGKQVELVIYDNKGDDAEAVTAFQRMVDEGITAFIGDVLTGNTIAVVGEAYPINMPMVTASATAAEVTVSSATGEVFSNVFRTCFIDPFQGNKMAQFAAQVLGAKTAAIICETGNDYSVGLAEAFKTTCLEEGVEVVAEEGYATGDKDFKSQLTNIAAKNPDVVFCPNYYEDDGMIVTQAREIGITASFMGGDGWATVKDFASAEDLEGCYYCSAYASGTTDAAVEFEKEFADAYGAENFNMFAATAYDAAMLMCAALEEAEKSGEEVGSDAYKQAVIDAIKTVGSSIKGVTSESGYTFDEFNNPIKDAVIIKLEGGEEVFDRVF